MLDVRQEIVSALIAEMKAKLLSATPETRADDDASIINLSMVLATFSAEPAMPALEI